MTGTVTREAASNDRRFAHAAAVAGIVLTVIVTAAIASHSLVLGSFEGGWFYGFARDLSALPLVLFGTSTAVFALTWWLVPPARARRRGWMAVVIWMVVASGVQAMLRLAAPASLHDIFVSDAANSFYSVSLQYEPADILRRFGRIQAAAPLHVQSNMPGKLLLLALLERVTHDPAALAWMIVAIANLGALLVYRLTRDIFDDGPAAVTAAVLYLFVPARLFFAPLMNTVTPVVALACACVFVRALRTGGLTGAAAFGASVYGLAFFEPLPLVLGLLFAALGAAAIAAGRVTWERAVLQAAIAALTLVATAEVIRVATGFDFVATFRRIGGHAVAFNASETRPYGVWVRMNLVEFTFGLGICQSVVLCGGVLALMRRPVPWRARLTTPFGVMAVGLMAVLAAVDLIGINRGEVIRLWIFLACFIQVPVAAFAVRAGAPLAAAGAVCASLLQAAIGMALIRFVVP